MLLTGHMDRCEPVLQGLLLEVEEAWVGNALQWCITKDPDEGFVIQGQEELLEAQGVHAGLVQAVDSSGCLPLDRVIAALSAGTEPGAAEDCLPSCATASKGWHTRAGTMLLHQPPPHAGLAPVGGKPCGEVDVEQPDTLGTLAQDLLLGLLEDGLQLLAPVEGDLGA